MGERRLGLTTHTRRVVVTRKRGREDDNVKSWKIVPTVDILSADELEVAGCARSFRKCSTIASAFRRPSKKSMPTTRALSLKRNLKLWSRWRVIRMMSRRHGRRCE